MPHSRCQLRRLRPAITSQKLCAELAGGGKEVTPAQYLFLFLKFISCVIPTVEYDYTLAGAAPPTVA